MRNLLTFFLLTLTFYYAKGQQNNKKKVSDSIKNERTLDTLNAPKYVNQGKIAGKKAVYRSLIFPGLGQAYNYGLIVDDIKSGRVQTKRVGQKIYIIGKIAAIYGGGTLLVSSYIDNNNNYKRFLHELQYRQSHNNQPDPEGNLQNYPNTDALIVAKNIYKRNREVVLISLVGLYGLNVLDAYITARLKYFSVDETLSFKISPSVISTGTATMYGYQSVPAMKLTLRF